VLLYGKRHSAALLLSQVQRPPCGHALDHREETPPCRRPIGCNIFGLTSSEAGAYRAEAR